MPSLAQQLFLIARLMLAPWRLADTALRVGVVPALLAGAISITAFISSPFAIAAGTISEPYPNIQVYYALVWSSFWFLFLLVFFVVLAFIGLILALAGASWPEKQFDRSAIATRAWLLSPIVTFPLFVI